MNFVVFECLRTVELCEAAVEAGYAAWVPIRRMERRRRERRKDHKVVSIEMVDVRVAAMPGYIFVAANDWINFRRWASVRYSVAVMTEYYGPGGLPGPKRAHLIRPVTVTTQQIAEMDRLLRAEWAMTLELHGAKPPAKSGEPAASLVAEELPPLAVGTVVEIVAGLFKGMTGAVVKVKNHEVRLDLAERFVTMPRNWVIPQNSSCNSL